MRLDARIAVVALSASLGLTLGGSDPAAVPAATDPAADAGEIHVAIDARQIPTGSRNGLTFKGFGLLTANSTSALLMDYKALHPERYAQLLQILFGGPHPLLDHIKIEMGNDRDNSTGADPASQRRADEPVNLARVPGFQLAADARRFNRHLKVSLLRWNAPAWVGHDHARIYAWYKQTILAANRQYGYMVGFVNPGLNERAPDLRWVKQFARRLRADQSGFRDTHERNRFQAIGVISSDEVGVGTFGPQLMTDAALRDAIAVAGYHYSTEDDAHGSFRRFAEHFDHEVWNSEAQATFSDSALRPHATTRAANLTGSGLGGTGSALEMANTIIKGFVRSRRTHFIYQPLIGAFYEGGQYSYKELVSARDPWSGWIRYDAGLAVLQHFTSFSRTGWENAAGDSGIWRVMTSASASTAIGINPVSGRNGGANYLTLAAPDGSNFSTVIVNDSERTQHYRISPRHFDLVEPRISAWETRAADPGQRFDAYYKHRLDVFARPADGSYSVRVAPNSIVTVSSLDTSGDAGWNTPLPVAGPRPVLDVGAPGGLLWSDDFDYRGRTAAVIAADGRLIPAGQDFIASRGGPGGTTPLYLWNRNGAFEAVRDDRGHWALQQQIDRRRTGVGEAWNPGDPVASIGDMRWSNYRASVRVRLGDGDRVGGPHADPAAYAAIGVRSTRADGAIDGTPYVLRLHGDGRWQLRRFAVVIATGRLPDTMVEGTWHRLALQAEGDVVRAFIDDRQLVRFTDPSPYLSGRVDLGSSFQTTRFDALEVTALPAALPYYSRYLDGLETTDPRSPTHVALDYRGHWDLEVGAGMYEYQRSRARSDQPGASLSYTFTGSGLDLTGPNDGSARLDVEVDGGILALAQPTRESAYYQQTFSLRGLPWGRHTVTLRLVSGTLNVDALGVFGQPAQGSADSRALAAALATTEHARRGECTQDAWQALQHAIAATRQAVRDPAGYRLDSEGAAQLMQRLRPTCAARGGTPFPAPGTPATSSHDE